MIDRQQYSQGGNFLKADDVKDGTTFIIEKFEEIRTAISKTSPVLRLKGVEKPFGLNMTNLDRLVELHGNDEKKFPGKKIKLVHVQAPNPKNKGKEQKALRIA